VSLAELVDLVSSHTGLPKTQVRSTIKATQNAVIGVLKSGEKVVFPGFGTFSHFDIKPRALFGGRRVAKVRRKIRFRQTRTLR
jgi:nucleoid DNA-binding protein